MNKPLLHGIQASVVLLVFYFAIVTLVMSFQYTVRQFVNLSYLMVPLVIGFGMQVSLFSHLRMNLRNTRHTSAGVTGCGGVSAVSMIACCAHHITDVIPIIGLSTVALVLVQFQAYFIIVGILSNLIGIATLLNLIQVTGVPAPSPLRPLLRFNMRRVRNSAMIFSVVVLPLSFLIISLSGSQEANPQPTTIDLPSKTATIKGIEFQIDPRGFSIDSEITFFVKIDTHAGSLDFDLIKVATLIDSGGRISRPIDWNGSPPGGHHREGLLTFPQLSGESDYLRLTINLEDGGELVLVWDLP